MKIILCFSLVMFVLRHPAYSQGEPPKDELIVEQFEELLDRIDALPLSDASKEYLRDVLVENLRTVVLHTFTFPRVKYILLDALRAKFQILWAEGSISDEDRDKVVSAIVGIRVALWDPDLEAALDRMPAPPLAPPGECSVTILVPWVDDRIVRAGSDAHIIVNDTLVLGAIGVPSGGTYSWNFLPLDTPGIPGPAGLLSPANRPQRAIFESIEQGVFEIKVTYTDLNGKMCEDLLVVKVWQNRL